MPGEVTHEVTALLAEWSGGNQAARDELKGRIVELRYFGGMTVEEVSEVLGVARHGQAPMEGLAC